MSWWSYERKYEKEYRLARRIGKIVAGKMIKDNTSVVRLRVRPDNPLANWFHSAFGGYRTCYGGWCHSSSDKCFQEELFYGWLRNQPDRDEFYEKEPAHLLRVIRSKYTILFLNLVELPLDKFRVIWDLENELTDLERSEVADEFT